MKRLRSREDETTKARTKNYIFCFCIAQNDVLCEIISGIYLRKPKNEIYNTFISQSLHAAGRKEIMTKNNQKPTNIPTESISIDVSIDSAEIQINRQHCFIFQIHFRCTWLALKTHRVIFIMIFFFFFELVFRLSFTTWISVGIVVSTSHDIKRAPFSFSLTVLAVHEYELAKNAQFLYFRTVSNLHLLCYVIMRKHEDIKYHLMA